MNQNELERGDIKVKGSILLNLFYWIFLMKASEKSILF